MPTSGTDKSRRADQAAEPTGDFAAHNTASDAPAAAQPDPLLSLLRPPQAAGELGRLAHFAVTRLLGRGGMGAVFAADDLLVRRQVALKVMRPEFTSHPEARERFLREAQTAGGLEHDHVIPVYQVAEDNGVWFIAMPLLKGEALDERLKREGRLPIPAVLKLGRETAEGLAAAHAQGLVHRDVKPGNLWLEGTGEAGGAGFRRVKILDFGLARAVQDDQHLTAAGGVLGTPAYMAPEQASGAEVDHRTDLFSLGVVLYRCCAGELPFQGPNTMATLLSLATKEAVPVGEKNPAVPAALADLIMRLLAKAPGDRPQSAEDVAEALRRIEQEHAVVTAQAAQAPAPRRRRVSALTLCVAALVVLGLAAVAAVIVVKVRTPDGKETQVTAPTGSQVNVDAKGNVTVALPADAPLVLAPADGANKPADPPELEFRLKEGTSEIQALVITPDGKTAVAGYMEGCLRVWDLETRQVVRSYVASSGVKALALHPDGKTVAAMCNDGSLFTWDIQKGEVIRQFTGYPVHAWGVTFAKKGELIVTPDRDTQAVVCWDAKTGEHRVLARFPDEKHPLDSIAASPDGEQVAVTTEGGPARLLNPSSGEVVWTSRWFGQATPVFLHDRKTVAVGRGPASTIWAWDPAARYPSRVFCGEAAVSTCGLAVSPDGRFLAAAGGGCGKVDLWVQDRMVRFREWSGLAAGDALRVAFTPDGRRLLSAHQGVSAN